MDSYKNQAGRNSHGKGGSDGEWMQILDDSGGQSRPTKWARLSGKRVGISPKNTLLT